jgi:protein-S-isoprenylcysteine O-methyltransferase Ste14
MHRGTMSDLARTLARYRVRLGFASAVAAMWLATPTRQSLMTGAAVAVAGEGLRIWAAGHLEKGREVTASGPYRLTRHPLYLGSAVIALGFAMAASSLAATALVILYLVLTYGAAIKSEEAHLTEKFGTAYPEYRDGRAPGAERRFSVERAMRNREYRAVGGLLLALALLAWKVL